MNDFGSYALGVVIGMACGLTLAGACGAYDTKQEECAGYCGQRKYDGGVMRFDVSGYDCRCANLQAVTP